MKTASARIAANKRQDFIKEYGVVPISELHRFFIKKKGVLMTKEEVLKKYFGYDSFRAGQETLVERHSFRPGHLRHHAHGSGKVPLLPDPGPDLMPGITLVISPLISLMKDQVAALNQAGIHAAYLNSSLTPGPVPEPRIRNLIQGRYKIVYVAPERLHDGELSLGSLPRSQISMVSGG